MKNAAFDGALKAALRLLRAKDRFENELKQKLILRGFESETCEQVLAFLKENRLLNESQVLENAIRTRGRNLGRERLRAELTQRMARPGLLESELAQLDAEQEKQKALTLLNKKFKLDEKPDRCARFLSSRGFEEDIVEAALENFFGKSMEELLVITRKSLIKQGRKEP